MSSIETRITKLESTVSPRRPDGRYQDMVDLYQQVYAERFDLSAVPVGMTVSDLLRHVAEFGKPFCMKESAISLKELKNEEP